MWTPTTKHCRMVENPDSTRAKYFRSTVAIPCSRPPQTEHLVICSLPRDHEGEHQSYLKCEQLH
mgnify:FL=1